MSQPIITATPMAGAPRADVQAAIARAAQSTGIDFSYLLGQARIESSFDPGAQADTSSAAGLYQFTGGTWLAMLGRHGAEHGLGWAQQAIAAGGLDDPATRAQVMALRFDPQASAAMAAELASENRTSLQGVLGREPDPAELYLAHFLGADGAGRFLSAMGADPDQSAAALLPRAAGANHAIFYSPGGSARSLGEVMGLIRGRMNAAMEAGPAGPAASLAGAAPFAGWTMPGLGTPAVAAEPAAQRPSMASTLASAFGLAGGGEAVPDHVRAAYGKLQALGL